MWAAMVVGPEPAVKRGGAFSARSVDRAVGPAAQHRSDEALGLAVGAWPVGPGAQMPQAEQAAGDGVDRRAITGAVVAHHALHRDPVAGVESDRAAQESRCGGALLVCEHLDVGQASGVIDADVHELPTLGCAAPAGTAVCVLARALAGHAVPGAGDHAEPLDVDVDQLARACALVAICRLGRFEPAELAQPDPPQDRRDGRERHTETDRDLRSGHPQPPQRRDRPDPVLGRAVRDRPRRRAAIDQPILALVAVARDPLSDRPLRDLQIGRDRLSGLAVQGPTDNLQSTFRTGRRVSVQLHPVPSSWSAAASTSRATGAAEAPPWPAPISITATATSAPRRARTRRTTRRCSTGSTPRRPSEPARRCRSCRRRRRPAARPRRPCRRCTTATIMSRTWRATRRLTTRRRSTASASAAAAAARARRRWRSSRPRSPS